MLREPLTDFEILVKEMLDARKVYKMTKSRRELHRIETLERKISEHLEERECEANGQVLIRLTPDKQQELLSGLRTLSTRG